MRIPKALQGYLTQRKVIPFVGSGVSRSLLDRQGSPLFPTWSELLEQAAVILREDGRETDSNLVLSLVAKGELVEAARRARDGLGTAHWFNFLKAIFDRTYDEVDPGTMTVARQVWDLGSNLVITTNYDRSLQWSCPDRADFRVWDIEAKVEQVNAIREGGVLRPTVWHLHGQIDNAVELIVTPNGYASLYGDDQKEADYKAALDTLRTLLKSHSLLFIGFSLSDAQFMKQMTAVNNTFGGASGQHYAILPQRLPDQIDPRDYGVEPIYYLQHADISNILSAMAISASQSSPTYVKAGRYIVDRTEGLYLFGGRGDAFFQLYDAAVGAIRSNLDIFSLKLSRFRINHGSRIAELAKIAKIRIALLDPSFPLPADNCSLACIREREEGTQAGGIRRDVAAWLDVYNEYQTAINNGDLELTDNNGLEIKLYNALPTVNLFRVDDSLFVGPYLLEVEDRETPTFLIKSEGPGHRSMGNTMFSVYARHFEAVWSNPDTRSIVDVTAEEAEAWNRGAGLSAKPHDKH